VQLKNKAVQGCAAFFLVGVRKMFLVSKKGVFLRGKNLKEKI